MVVAEAVAAVVDVQAGGVIRSAEVVQEQATPNRNPGHHRVAVGENPPCLDIATSIVPKLQVLKDDARAGSPDG